MSWARGLFRLWLVASAAWLIGWVLFIRGRCHPLPNGGMVCEHDRAGILSFMGAFVAWTPFQVYLLGLAVPLAVLVVGVIVTWVRSRRGLP